MTPKPDRFIPITLLKGFLARVKVQLRLASPFERAKSFNFIDPSASGASNFIHTIKCKVNFSVQFSKSPSSSSLRIYMAPVDPW